MHHYINFYFRNIKYDESHYEGLFECPDLKLSCEFDYDRRSKMVKIWNNTHSEEEILPLPIWWLDMKLEENGKLNSMEAKISY